MSEESTSAELPEGLGEIPLLDHLPVSMQSHLKTPAPDQLWHYTSMNAMQSIVEHGEMYATDARFLNDRDELIHAAEFADTLIKTQDHPPEVITFVRQHVARWFGVPNYVFSQLLCGYRRAEVTKSFELESIARDVEVLPWIRNDLSHLQLQ
jgi:hypothetical protein